MQFILIIMVQFFGVKLPILSRRSVLRTEVLILITNKLNALFVQLCRIVIFLADQHLLLEARVVSFDRLKLWIVLTDEPGLSMETWCMITVTGGSVVMEIRQFGMLTLVFFIHFQIQGFDRISEILEISWAISILTKLWIPSHY